jgi:Zn-dependent protease
MRGIPRLGQIFRVRLRLHRSWVIAFILITAIVVTQFPEAYPLWQRVVLGIATSFLFFIAVSIREISLDFLALNEGIPGREVTLFVFGGVSQVAQEETRPALELLLAVAGLLSNLVIAGVFYAIHSVLVNTGSVLFDGLILWLSFIYFMLALLHFIPVFPLDGGRVLRVLLWKATGNYDGATRVVSWAGQVTGFLFIAGGILLLIFSRQWINGLVLALIGWVLNTGATQGHRPVILRETLDGLMARDVIAREDNIVKPKLSLGQLVRDYIMVTGQRYFAVADGTELLGVVTIRNIKSVPQKRWDSTTVGEIMTPTSELKRAQAEQPAASLLEQMNEWHIDHIPVLEQDRVIGIVARDNIMSLLKTRRELKLKK